MCVIHPHRRTVWGADITFSQRFRSFREENNSALGQGHGTLAALFSASGKILPYKDLVFGEKKN